METRAEQALSLELYLPNLPSGVNVVDMAGSLVFVSDGKPYCYLQKYILYRVALDGAVTVDEVGERLRSAVDDFNKKVGIANVLGKET